MSALLFDTNVLIDFTLYEYVPLTDNRRVNVKRFLDAGRADCVVSISSMLEYSSVMQKVIPLTENALSKGPLYQFICMRLAQKVLTLLSENSISYHPLVDDTEKALEIHHAFMLKKLISKSFDLNDALLIAIALNRNFELVTNDRELKRLYESLMKTT